MRSFCVCCWVLGAMVAASAGAAHAADPAGSRAALESLKTHLKVEAAQRPPLAAAPFASVALTKPDAQQAHALLWADHAALLKVECAAEVKERTIKEGDKTMPFFYTLFGDKPPAGRSLYISMHGGGNTRPATNDQQWENQKRLYKLTEGVYLAPRAPTNTWNLWHEPHIDRMFQRLIEDMILFEDVDPNRVYLMGYSAGGDGVYQLAPRMADRFAAAAMMAGHPNDSSPAGLRNLPFSVHVGALDSGFDRNKVAMEWEGKMAALRRDDLPGYVHWVKLYEGRPHWMNGEDAAAIPWMAQFTRNPTPAKVVWQQGHVPHTRFYWLAMDAAEAKKGAQVVASYGQQQVTVESKDVAAVMVRLHDGMMDLDKPVTVKAGEKQVFSGTVERTIGVMARMLAERGDPAALFCAEIRVPLK